MGARSTIADGTALYVERTPQIQRLHDNLRATARETYSDHIASQDEMVIEGLLDLLEGSAYALHKVSTALGKLDAALAPLTGLLGPGKPSA